MAGRTHTQNGRRQTGRRQDGKRQRTRGAVQVLAQADLIGVFAARYPGAAIFDPETNAVHCIVWGHAKDNEECTCRHDAGILKDCHVANPNCPVRGHAPA